MRHALALAAAVFAAGCQHARPFDNSSADFNKGKPHDAKLRASVDDVAGEIAAVMQERGAPIVRRRETAPGTLVLSFKKNAERAVGAKIHGGRNSARLEHEYIDW